MHPLARNITCPLRRRGIFLKNPNHTDRSCTPIVNVHLFPESEVNDVAIDGCLLVVGFPRSLSFFTPIPCIACILPSFEFRIEFCRHLRWNGPPHVILESNLDNRDAFGLLGMLCSTSTWANGARVVGHGECLLLKKSCSGRAGGSNFESMADK